MNQSDPLEPDDLKIISEETIEISIKRQGIAHARLALTLSVSVVGLYALAGLIILVWSFFTGREAPPWAAAAETSTVTAALALIFKDQLPSRK